VPRDGHASQLVAFVATARFDTTTWTALQERLGATIPAFSVPSSFFHLSALPRGPGGKIDRAALVEQHVARFGATGEHAPPRNDLEWRIAAAVESVLEIYPISIKDDLFDLGLDSLRYADLLLLLEQELGRRLPDEVFVHARTVEQLAAAEFFRRPDGVTPTVPGGGQDYGKPWPRLHREMRARYYCARLLGMLPFRWSFAGLSWLSHQLFFRQAWPVRQHVKLVLDFFESVEGGANLEQDVSRSLCCNYVQPWLLRSLARAVTKRFDQQCSVEGMEYFERARQSGRGVILAVSHFGIPHADLLVLDLAGGKDIVTFGSFEYELELMGLEHMPHVQLAVEPVGNFLFRANFLRRARMVLESGGVVRIAADGLHGTSGRAWPFHGRNRHFRPGVGELAVLTGAPVLPVFGVLTDKGRMLVQFLPELERAAPGLTRKEAVDSYVGQYVRLLEQRWVLDPGSVVWEIARAHLGSPRAIQQ
jgi:acyl carrier protein